MVAQRFMNRKRLLDAARGTYKPTSVVGRESAPPQKEGGDARSSSKVSSSTPTRPLRCFRLRPEHVQEMFSAPTPDNFHHVLCEKIRRAKKRVYLASLYIGPAACQKAAPKEQELLDAIQEAAQNTDVDIKILLDKNRALRPVPLSGNVQSSTTSSAQAVYQALQSCSKDGEAEEKGKNKLFLFSVLPQYLQYFLPNPYNEVMGVFHIKVYIVDDSIILSGANLSEEYFVDRHDRYLYITNGGAGLVDCYADLVKALCDHATIYQEDHSEKGKISTSSRKPTTRLEFLDSLTRVLTLDSNEASRENMLLMENGDETTVAYAVPTFQYPKGFFPDSYARCFLSDIEVTSNLLKAALEEAPDAIVRLSSAYLNPTDSFLRVLADFENIEFLTAGRTSHGFAPKKKAGNKGKDWIPTVFDTLSREACEHLEEAKLFHYSRTGWTFHAKGLWLEEKPISDTSTCTAAAIFGSGNYGARSETLDMESNCVLVLPKDSELQAPLQKEWHDMMEFTQSPVKAPQTESAEETLPQAHDPSGRLSWPLQVCLPLIRKFL